LAFTLLFENISFLPIQRLVALPIHISSLRPVDSIDRFTLLSVRSPPCLPDQANLCFLSPCRFSSVTSPFIYLILLHTHWLTLFPHEASLPVYANIRSTIYTSSWPCLL
jgi:hypothetical protein